jgi:hypothetical protein
MQDSVLTVCQTLSGGVLTRWASMLIFNERFIFYSSLPIIRGFHDAMACRFTLCHDLHAIGTRAFHWLWLACEFTFSNFCHNNNDDQINYWKPKIVDFKFLISDQNNNDAGKQRYLTICPQ